MDREKLWNAVMRIQEEIIGLYEHGDIPTSAYGNLMDVLENVENIINE